MRSLPRILIVEDEPAIAELIAVNLRHNGFQPIWAMDGETAQKELDDVLPDVILLDWMLPKESGLSLAKKWRADKRSQTIPILMLTARGDEVDRVAGLDAGADDYITKPFDSEVLLLKIKAILKRNEELHKEEINAEYDLGSYHFNPKLRELIVNGKTQVLSPKENELLKMLSEYKNDLLQRELALKKIWGNDNYFNGRSMDVYIAKLRKYLKEDPNVEIVNIHGNGFRLIVK